MRSVRCEKRITKMRKQNKTKQCENVEARTRMKVKEKLKASVTANVKTKTKAKANHERSTK